MNKIITFAPIAALSLGLAAPSASGAAPVDAERADRHCVVEVTPDRDGVLVTTAETCFDTFADASAYAGASGGESRASRAAGTNTIGLHFTGTFYSGSSVHVVGTTCGGGVWPATGFWNNNIESSYHYCGGSPTRFWDTSSCGSSSLPITSATPSLGNMNNRTSCVQYG